MSAAGDVERPASPEGLSQNTAATAADVLAFWRAAGSDKWFEKDAAFDDEIRRRFLATYEAAAALDALALLIVLDQFPRNMFRRDARTYAADPLARAVAARAVARGFDQNFAPAEQTFFYLPFEHSEDIADQERGLALFTATGDAELIKYAQEHVDIIRRFGRFPHRNPILGRDTTPDEQAFLDDGGFAG